MDIPAGCPCAAAGQMRTTQNYKLQTSLRTLRQTAHKLITYFKAANCLILAWNTPSAAPHAGRGGTWGVGGAFEAKIEQMAALKHFSGGR